MGRGLMGNRSIKEISLDMKSSVLNLMDATKRSEQAGRDMLLVLIEMSELLKELERSALDQKMPLVRDVF